MRHMVEIKYVKDFKLREKEDIRDGCDVQVIIVSELEEEIEEFENEVKGWRIRHPKGIHYGHQNDTLAEAYAKGQNDTIMSVLEQLADTKKRLGIDG